MARVSGPFSLFGRRRRSPVDSLDLSVKKKQVTSTAPFREKETLSMFENIDVKEAIKRSIQTEKNAMDFYRLGASRMQNDQARKTFELLASEEREHAAWFYHVYLGDDIPDFDTFMAADPIKDSDWLTDLEKILLPDFNERKAMELAMDKELKLEKSLREMAAKIADDKVRKVFEANAESTHNHYLLIESEYARLMGMVHETDIDTFVRE
jgi:rubrerythrin